MSSFSPLFLDISLASNKPNYYFPQSIAYIYFGSYRKQWEFNFFSCEIEQKLPFVNGLPEMP